LMAIFAVDKSAHPNSPLAGKCNYIMSGVFTQSGPKAALIKFISSRKVSSKFCNKMCDIFSISWTNKLLGHCALIPFPPLCSNSGRTLVQFPINNRPRVIEQVFVVQFYLVRTPYFGTRLFEQITYIQTTVEAELIHGTDL